MDASEVEELHRLSGDQLQGHARKPPAFGLPTQRPNDLIGLIAVIELFGPNAADVGPVGIVWQDFRGPDLISGVGRALHIDRQRVPSQLLPGLRCQQRLGRGRIARAQRVEEDRNNVVGRCRGGNGDQWRRAGGRRSQGCGRSRLSLASCRAGCARLARASKQHQSGQQGASDRPAPHGKAPFHCRRRLSRQLMR